MISAPVECDRNPRTHMQDYAGFTPTSVGNHRLGGSRFLCQLKIWGRRIKQRLEICGCGIQSIGAASHAWARHSQRSRSDLCPHPTTYEKRASDDSKNQKGEDHHKENGAGSAQMPEIIEQCLSANARQWRNQANPRTSECSGISQLSERRLSRRSRVAALAGCRGPTGTPLILTSCRFRALPSCQYSARLRQNRESISRQPCEP